jgi:hypothetical protein
MSRSSDAIPDAYPAGSDESEIIEATKRLLGSAVAGDISTYELLSAKDLTCFEPETRGHLITGLGFHRHFLEIARGGHGHSAATLNTLVSPSVRMLGKDHALISYVRVVQCGDKVTSAEETRVWRRTHTGWQNLHFHRSKF